MMEFWGYLAELVTRSDERTLILLPDATRPQWPPTNGHETLLRKTPLQQKWGERLGLVSTGRGAGALHSQCRLGQNISKRKKG